MVSASSVNHKHFWKTLIPHHEHATQLKQHSRNKGAKGSRSRASSEPTYLGGSLGNTSSVLATTPAFPAPAQHAQWLGAHRQMEGWGSQSPRRARAVFAPVQAPSKVKPEKGCLILHNFILYTGYSYPRTVCLMLLSNMPILYLRMSLFPNIFCTSSTKVAKLPTCGKQGCSWL